MPGGVQKGKTARAPGKREVLAELKRIKGSADFDTSRRSGDFLEFVVEETLAGRENAISQHAIAARVFGRGDEFDPATDPIVRMQAGRVRRSLEHYYLTAGVDDPVLIALPKGSYVPAFEFREARPKAPQSGTAPAGDDCWPTLLVSPLRNLSGREDAEFIARGLASDMAAELSREMAIHVFRSPDPEAVPKRACHARFELGGTLDLRGDDLKINLHLVDGNTARQIWAHTYFCPAGPDRGAILDMAVQTTVSMITEEHGILTRHLSEESRQRPSTGGNAYEAILRYHHFDVTNEPAVFAEALAALRKAVDANPDCAVCWSYLARLGGAHWSLGVPGDVIPIEDSIAAARRGAGLAPQDVRCRTTLSYLLLLADEVDEARHEAEVALALSGRSIFWLDAVGYLLSLSGDWERGPAIVRRAVEINPFPRRACYGALWLDALRRDDPPAALAAAREYAPEAYFWSPLMEAVALVAADRTDEAAAAVERVLRLKPDFPERAHWLITRYVKFAPLVQRIEDALATAELAPVDAGAASPMEAGELPVPEQ